MTTLGTETDLFKKFQQFRDDIMKAQSLSELTEVRKAIVPYTNITPEQGGLKLDLRKILDNCFKIKDAELYGEAPPQTDMNTQEISPELQPKESVIVLTPQAQAILGKKTITRPIQGAEEVKLPHAPLEGRAKEISEEMKPIDAENFKTPIQAPSPTAEALNPTSAPVSPTETTAPVEKKSRSRSKPTEESSIEYIPRSQKSVKVYRRINVSINGVAYTNNEIGYEIVADTREEALEEAKALRESSLADIRELNELMKVKPVTQTIPPTTTAPIQVTPPPVATAPAPSLTPKDMHEVFPDATFDLDKVMKAIAAKNPEGLSEGHEFDRYNLERLRALFTILKSVDEVAVQMPDGSGMMLGTFITQETQKFTAQFPMAKPAK